jgi:hypothetical protein
VDRTVLKGAAGIVVLLLIVLGVYWFTKPSDSQAQSATATSPTQSRPTSPDSVADTEFYERVMQFEEAYHTLDIQRRKELLAPLATEEYLQSDALRTMAIEQFDGPVVKALRDKNKYPVSVESSSDDKVRYVSTIVYIEKWQNDKLLSSGLEEIPHDTTWVLTDNAEWRVAKETTL